ncbi:MAG: galactose-1-phosphate uridylyltransferase [Fimbriimonadales bacterium]|nr:galactose-1-phosphate uridylyltransferase [Fimbriimonadales bacterium]
MPEIRWDIITEERVIIATERSRRPHDFKRTDAPAEPKPAFVPNCPFCEGNESMTPPEVDAFRAAGTQPDSPGWRVRVVPNKFPALASAGDANPRAQGIYTLADGVGAHEVIIETPRHHETPVVAPLTQWTDALRMYQNRLRALAQDEQLKTILIFRNEGKAAGASLEHPHAQLVGLTFIPPVVQRHLDGVQRYRTRHGKHPFEAIIEQELREGTRLVRQTERFLLYVPFAARVPYELLIVPLEPVARFEQMSEPLLQQFAMLLQDALQRLYTVLNDPPYNYMLFTAPAGYESEFWLHLRIVPRLSIEAGFELGSGVNINITAPEDAARYLRECDGAAAS